MQPSLSAFESVMTGIVKSAANSTIKTQQDYIVVTSIHADTERSDGMA
jgi:hypothetical protein